MGHMDCRNSARQPWPPKLVSSMSLVGRGCSRWSLRFWLKFPVQFWIHGVPALGPRSFDACANAVQQRRPARIVKRGMRVLGVIDLQSCTCPICRLLSLMVLISTLVSTLTVTRHHRWLQMLLCLSACILMRRPKPLLMPPCTMARILLLCPAVPFPVAFRTEHLRVVVRSLPPPSF